MRKRCNRCCSECSGTTVTTTATQKTTRLKGRLRFKTRVKLVLEDAIAALKNTLVKLFGWDWWRILISALQGRRLQDSTGDWDFNYEYLALPEEADAVQKATESVSQDSSAFGEELKQQLVAVGVNQTVLEEDFTMGAFTASEIVITASTDTQPQSEEGSSYTAVIVGAAGGGLLLLVGFCLHLKYRRPREVVIEEETGIDANDLEDPKAVKSQGQSLETSRAEEIYQHGDDIPNNNTIGDDIRTGGMHSLHEPGTPVERQPREPSTPIFDEPVTPRDHVDWADVPDEYVGNVTTESSSWV